MNLEEMVDLALEEIEQPRAADGTVSGYWDPRSVVDRINEGYLYYASLEKQDDKSAYTGGFKDVDTTGSPNIKIPRGVDRISEVQILQASGKPFARRGLYRSALVRAQDTTQVTGTVDYLYDVYGNEIWTDPVVPAATAGIRIWTAPMTPRLLMGKFPANGADTTHLPLPLVVSRADGQMPAESRSDAYVDHYVHMTSGTEAGKVVLVTAYDGLTRIATVTPALALAVQAGDKFAFEPRLPEEHHNMLWLYAAIALREGKDEESAHLERRLKPLHDNFIAAIEERIQEPGRTLPWDIEYGFMN